MYELCQELNELLYLQSLHVCFGQRDELRERKFDDDESQKLAQALKKLTSLQTLSIGFKR